MHFSIKTLMAAVAASACAAAFAADMPKSISITYVKAPFNLQNIVMKERGMLEKAFEKDGVKIKWRVINSGALQGQAMASGDLDFSAVMNTASLLMAADPATEHSAAESCRACAALVSVVIIAQFPARIYEFPVKNKRKFWRRSSRIPKT